VLSAQPLVATSLGARRVLRLGRAREFARASLCKLESASVAMQNARLRGCLRDCPGNACAIAWRTFERPFVELQIARVTDFAQRNNVFIGG
jgi:hypothetical protein